VHRLRKQLDEFLREKRGDLTLAQFAKKLGLSDSTLQRLEIGEQNITIDSLERILDRLKCSTADIFKEWKQR
jgi:transcriptional regulator with XRE-family HTH domain